MTNELSMKELLDQQEQQLDKLQVGELITSSITKVSHGAVIISLECGFDGVIALDDLNIEEGKEIADVYKVGDEISAVITKVSPKDGTVRLSKVLADQENDLKELEVAHNEHKIVTVKVEKGTDFGMEQCANLPYTVSSVTEIENTDDAMDAYKLVVKVPDGEIYKAALDMIRTLLEEDIVPDASVSYITTSLALAGKPVLKEVPNHYLAANSDLDGDGIVDVQDAVELLTYYARKAANLPASFSHFDDQEAALQLADVNQDGIVDAADAVDILTYYTKQAAGLL